MANPFSVTLSRKWASWESSVVMPSFRKYRYNHLAKIVNDGGAPPADMVSLESVVLALFVVVVAFVIVFGCGRFLQLYVCFCMEYWVRVCVYIVLYMHYYIYMHYLYVIIYCFVCLCL